MARLPEQRRQTAPDLAASRPAARRPDVRPAPPRRSSPRAPPRPDARPRAPLGCPAPATARPVRGPPVGGGDGLRGSGSTSRRPRNSSSLPPMTIGTIGARDLRPTYPNPAAIVRAVPTDAGGPASGNRAKTAPPLSTSDAAARWVAKAFGPPFDGIGRIPPTRRTTQRRSRDRAIVRASPKNTSRGSTGRTAHSRNGSIHSRCGSPAAIQPPAGRPSPSTRQVLAPLDVDAGTRAPPRRSGRPLEGPGT